MAVEPVRASPRRDARRSLAWAPLAVATAALAALLALVAGRTADPLAAGVAGAMVLAVGGGLSLWLRDRAGERRGAGVRAAARPDAVRRAAVGASFAAVLEALEDPVLVVTGDEPDDLAGRRLIYANAAARELFRTSREAGPLVTAVRDPKVLEVVDEALFGGIASETCYAAGGVQDRVWRRGPGRWTASTAGGWRCSPCATRPSCAAPSAPAPTSWPTPATSCARRWPR